MIIPGQNGAQRLFPGTDELLTLGGGNADVSVLHQTSGTDGGAKASGESDDGNDGVGTDLTEPDLRVLGTAHPVDLKVVGGSAKGTGLDRGPRVKIFNRMDGGG